MSLLKLLSVGQSFSGSSDQGRYRLATGQGLPKLAPVQRPVTLAPANMFESASAAPVAIAEPLPTTPNPAPTPVAQPEPAAPSPKATVPYEVPTTASIAAAQVRKKYPFLLRPAARPTGRTWVQSELSLDSVKPLRNDLSDSDLEVVPMKVAIKPAPTAPAEGAAEAKPVLKAEMPLLYIWHKVVGRLTGATRGKAAR